METAEQRIKNVVFDGGPCGGKTTGITGVATRLMNMGIIPIIVPETATMLIQSGVSPKNMKPLDFQKIVMETQSLHEDLYDRIARKMQHDHGRPVVKILDRARLSGAAYMNSDNDLLSFQEHILSDFSMGVEEIRALYDVVIIPITAADGAEEFYTKINNTARFETPEEARQQCLKSRHIWLGHPHVALIGNSDKNGLPILFKGKVDWMIVEALRGLGLPEPLELESQYILKSFDPNQLPVKHESVLIHQDYLISGIDDFEERVRRRTWLGSSSYYHGTKRPAPVGRIETDHPVNAGNYLNLLLRRDPDTNTIRKTRHCFYWENQYFEVDVYHDELEGKIRLENEHVKGEETIVPPFIKIDREVTDDPTESNRVYARKRK